MGKLPDGIYKHISCDVYLKIVKNEVGYYNGKGFRNTKDGFVGGHNHWLRNWTCKEFLSVFKRIEPEHPSLENK